MSRKKKLQFGKLKILEGHSTRMVMLDEQETEEYLEESEEEAELSDHSDDEPNNADTENEQTGTHVQVVTENPNRANGETKKTRGSRQRKFQDIDNDDEMICGDPDCEEKITADELLHCNSPGCNLVYHLTYRGLVEFPKNNWFCDDECRKNAGYHVGIGQKRCKLA
ncbi:hypothetical protein BDQ17DRAFT_1336227 [Cyathus striatus]|nr:hypothetical protein BDQ17DRAFT_1336227 [Cyathus striatus]